MPPVHSKFHRWLAAPTQRYWSTRALLALLAPWTVRHLPLCRFRTYDTVDFAATAGFTAGTAAEAAAPRAGAAAVAPSATATGPAVRANRRPARTIFRTVMTVLIP